MIFRLVPGSVISAVLLALALLIPSATASAAISAADRESILAITISIKKAGNLFLQEDFRGSGEAIRAAQEKVAELAKNADAEMLKELQPLVSRLGRAHALLELEGIKLPPLQELKEKTDGEPAPAPAAGGTSFTKDVAPILVAKCGRCHVERASGMFSMANFSNLMKGTNAGVVVFAGDAVGSRIVEVIDSGDMPRGNLKVTPEEFATLKKWITEGAKFDGPNPETTLTSLVPGAKPADVPMLAVTAPTGKETVSFANDIAPVLNERCANCHGNGRRPSGRFDLTNFQSLLRGGESGAPIAPGKPEDSLLVKMLKGTGGSQRMPANQPPLADPIIAKIETWIKEGAAFDGPNPTQHIEQVAALAKATRSTHEQLSADRATAAEQNWNLGMPGIDVQTIETDNFLLMGNVGEKTLDDFGKQAEALVPKIATLFKVPADQPLVKGRITLYFFRQRYDYSEFGKMVEKREIPSAWRGHWNFSVVDAYGAMIAPRSDEYSLEALLAQQIAGTYVASIGQVPRWFAEGSARVAAAQVQPDDARIKAWDDSLSGVLGAMNQSDDFLTGKLPPEQADIASYSFVQFLRGDAKRYDGLMQAVRGGENFTQAFSTVYGGSPSQLSQRWAASAARRGRR
jgi:mono/diheme cytochrome c family protein